MALEEGRELLGHSKHVFYLLLDLREATNFCVPIWHFGFCVLLEGVGKDTCFVLAHDPLELCLKRVILKVS